MSEPGARRRQVVGFILSGIFPGLGQLYNREYLKGVLFLIPGAVLIWLVGRATPTDLLELAQPSAALMLLLAALLAIWLWAIIDAWKVAARWQAAEKGPDARRRTKGRGRGVVSLR